MEGIIITATTEENIRTALATTASRVTIRAAIIRNRITTIITISRIVRVIERTLQLIKQRVNIQTVPVTTISRTTYRRGMSVRDARSLVITSESVQRMVTRITILARREAFLCSISGGPSSTPINLSSVHLNSSSLSASRKRSIV